jgi:malonyl-CoA O-methyltransferase
MTSSAGVFDRRALARASDRAAAGYDGAARLQALARAELLQRLQFFPLDPERVVDLGAGTCQGALELTRYFRRAHIIAIDLAPLMLAQAPRSLWRRRRFERVCADAYALPLADGCCDLIFSNLMLQWREHLDELFAEARRVLRPGGLLLFSSFGPGTLEELRAAWASVDAGPHVNEFADLPPIAEALMRTGFAEPVIDVERQRHHYPSVQALKRELKQIGGQNVARSRARGLGGRARAEAMRAAYEQVREPAGLPATWELLYGAAFAGGERAGTAARPDEQVIPLDRIGRRGRPRGAPHTET